MPGVNIQAPSLKPPRVSILSSADVVSLPGKQDAWWGGIEYKKLSANPAQGIDSAFDTDDTFLLPICPVETTNKESYPRSATERVQPFAIYATDECSSFGITPAEMLDRAKQKLVSSEAWTIEHELWFGTGTANFSFADAGSVSVGTGLHPLIGFALVDGAVARDRGDGRGMVHVTVRTFNLLQQYNLFRREGNVWFSPNDNVVVPGRGYGDDDDATDAIYGHTGIIQIAHSEVFTYPSTPEDLGTFLNRQHNDFWVVAERVVTYFVPSALGTDGDTGVYKATVDPDLALPGSGSGGGSAPDYTALLAAISAATSDTDTNTDALEALVTALGANTDDMEALLSTIGNNTNGLEDSAALTNSKLDDVVAILAVINDSTDGMETLQTSTNTKLDTLTTALGDVDVNLEAIEVLLTTANGSIQTEDAVFTDGTGRTIVGGKRTDTPAASAPDGDVVNFNVDSFGAQWVHPVKTSETIKTTIAGMSNAAYAVNEQVGTEITIANAANVSGWGGVLGKVTVVDDLLVFSGNTASFDVYLFDVSVTGATDNNTFDDTDADFANLVDIIKFTDSDKRAHTSNAVYTKSGLSIPYTCAATSLFAIVVTRTALASPAGFSSATALRINFGLLKD